MLRNFDGVLAGRLLLQAGSMEVISVLGFGLWGGNWLLGMLAPLVLPVGAVLLLVPGWSSVGTIGSSEWLCAYLMIALWAIIGLSVFRQIPRIIGHGVLFAAMGISTLVVLSLD